MITICNVICIDNAGSVDKLAVRIIFNICDLSILKPNILHIDNSDNDTETLNGSVENKSSSSVDNISNNEIDDVNNKIVSENNISDSGKQWNDATSNSWYFIETQHKFLWYWELNGCIWW